MITTLTIVNNIALEYNHASGILWMVNRGNADWKYPKVGQSYPQGSFDTQKQARKYIDNQLYGFNS